MSHEREQVELVVQCMWCGRIKDPTEGWKGDGGPLLTAASHGLCPACALQHYGFRLRGSIEPPPDGPPIASARIQKDAAGHSVLNAGQGGT